MRILVLSFYYEPDLSAGSFRATSLVQALSDAIEDGGQIDVLSTQPNRYQSFNCEASVLESDTKVNIVRFALPKHRSGFMDQSWAFASYAWQCLKLLRGRKYDLVFATSSRLMTAFLGSIIARWKHIPLYLDIRDIFVDTIQDVLTSFPARMLLPAFRLVETLTIHKATHINLVSEGFRSYFEQRYPKQNYQVISNGIDEAFLHFDFSSISMKARERLIVLYAGNLGEGQGLHRIIPGLAAATHNTHEFWIVGDGGTRPLLESAVKGLNNVKIMSPVGRDALLPLYRQSDVLFLHLNDYPAFRRVLPSKLFEYAATGKPILAGVAGYAAEFLRPLSGVAIFPPCDIQAGIAALATIHPGMVPRETFIASFSRSKLMYSLSADILAEAQKHQTKT